MPLTRYCTNIIIKNNIYYMKHIKIFEARKTYAQKSKELREKFLTLIDANISDDEKVEIEDVLRSIFDIVGSPNFKDSSEVTFFIKYEYIKGGNTGHIFFNESVWIEDANTYKELRGVYDNLIHGNIKLSAILTYGIRGVSEESARLAEEESAYVKETLESMGYIFEFIRYSKRDVTDKDLRLNVIKADIDTSSIIEDKEYYSSLPRSIIKDFDMFMLQYKVPEEKAAEFANLLGSADWSKEE